MSHSEGPLRAARVARGWSQSRATKELMSLAQERGVAVAAPHSLKTQLSRWENQHAVPDEHYRALLAELYASTEAELGLSPASPQSPLVDEREALRAGLTASEGLDEAALDLLRAQLRTSRAIDNRLGGAAVADTSRAQLSHLERVLLYAVCPRLRSELGWLVADAASLMGSLELDQGRPVESWRHYQTARAAASEVECPPLLGYLMVEQSYVLLEIGMHELALDLQEQAESLMATDAPGHVRARLDLARGEAFAMTGSVHEARLAYQLAEKRLDARPRKTDTVYARPPFAEFDLGAFHRHRGHIHRLLHDRDAAVTDLERALLIGSGSTRDRASIHVDLAYAHGASGDVSAAAQHARAARQIAVRIGSVRLAGLLDATPASTGAEPATRS